MINLGFYIKNQFVGFVDYFLILVISVMLDLELLVNQVFELHQCFLF